jgi:hypothetical protein
MIQKSLIRVTEKETINLMPLVTKAVSYDFNGCADFPDAEIRVLDTVNEVAPKEAEFYRIVSEGEPNRPFGLGLAGQLPLKFTQLVQYYRKNL